MSAILSKLFRAPVGQLVAIGSMVSVMQMGGKELASDKESGTGLLECDENVEFDVFGR